MPSSVHFSAIDPDLLATIGVHEARLLNPTRAVYANRDLDLGQIKMVGFDMDYTLAIYRKLPMEQLQYDLTVQRLVTRLGYPSEIKDLAYDPSFILRGLTVDKRNGHLLKTDTHGRVGNCFHGRRRLQAAEVERIYRNAKIRLASATFSSVDTLFALPEVCLYANLVDFFETRLARGEPIEPLALPPDHETPNIGGLDTWKLFDDVRNAIDDIHRDGTLKSIIMSDIGTYVVDDEGLALTLHKLRSAGKRLFLLTNSYWRYTDALMTFLLDGKLKEYGNWRAYFDIVVVGGRKPRFFTDREPFAVLDLQQTQMGEPPPLVGEAQTDRFERGNIYQGGNIEAFERMAECAGEEILYVGDHIFGDILRSKKDSRWRTALIVEELEHEIANHLLRSRELERLSELDARRHALDEAIGYQRALLSHLEITLQESAVRKLSARVVERVEESSKRLRREIDQAKRLLRALDKEGSTLQADIERNFNPSWGRLLKEKNELSRFGGQVAFYADTYTSRVSNFLQYSPVHYFRAPRERMSHDRLISESQRLIGDAPEAPPAHAAEGVPLAE